MAAAFQRVPFGEVSASRLQGLQSAKNRQNPVSELAKPLSLSMPLKSPVKGDFQLASPTKRTLSVFEGDHNSDEENVNPIAAQSTKKAKVDHVSSDVQKPAYHLNVNKPVAPLTTLTPAVKRKHVENHISSPIPMPASAPAGRDIMPLKHKRVGLLSNKRSSLSPFKRIDPPTFGAKKSSGLPFSIDAAINGSDSTQVPPVKLPKLHKAMPKGWFFDIHEDTPEEEASIVMHHSCLNLDLSSDDEEGPAFKKARMDKENIAPEDYVAAHINANVSPRSRKANADAMTDEGDRSPLSDLAPEEFFANGLHKDSVAVIAAEETEEAGEVEPEAAQEESVDEQQGPQAEDFTFKADPMPALSKNVQGSNDHQVDFVIAEDADASNP